MCRKCDVDCAGIWVTGARRERHKAIARKEALARKLHRKLNEGMV